jgi:type I restriction enzyme S subunit
VSHPGDYPVYSSSAMGAGEFGRYGRFMFDEELITWSIDGGGRPFYRPEHRFSVTNVCGYLRIKKADAWNYRYLHALLEKLQSGIQFDYQMKAHPSVIRELYRFGRIPLDEQQEIGEILDTLDTAIHKTEAIIAKFKSVKQGLLHDLLTRGIDANGELRPPQAEAPHLYKQSPLGWIPMEWAVTSIGDLSESLVDGPFGSNLKTAHYVENPGVRVVRLQNILAGEYDDSERAFVSDRHAASLARNRVTAGDVLIASLGDANYPVGRSCCYPADLPDAINKADCFRFRSGPLCRNDFVMFSMNGSAVRKQVRGYEQGVTMKRINLGNLRRVQIPLPLVPEQEMIAERLCMLQKQIDATALELQKRLSEKSGLMDDLLTGRVRVTPLLEGAP